jgi:hypothetical protein
MAQAAGGTSTQCQHTWLFLESFAFLLISVIVPIAQKKVSDESPEGVSASLVFGGSATMVRFSIRGFLIHRTCDHDNFFTEYDR